ncbi:MAG TPA: signal peptidase I [Candidatus Methanoperedens sp.]|nr:signal peptidase I [Candidatus Methanoperedens sp.]
MLKKNILFKALEWVVFVVLLSLLGLVISPKLPIKNIPKSFIVVTGSMEPAIKTGSVVFVKNVDPTLIKRGDIIAFTSPNDSKDTILHRVHSIKSTNPLRFSTKGDANNSPDPWDVMDVGVKGVSFASLPYLGYIGSYIKTPLGFSLFIGFPALIFIIIQLFNIKKIISEEVERKVTQTLSINEKSKPPTINIKSITIFIAVLISLITFSTIKAIRASYSDSVTMSGITLSTGCWTKPSLPQHIYPEDNYSALKNDPWFQNPYLDWTDSTTSCPLSTGIYYQYESYYDEALTRNAYRSGKLSQSKIPAPGTPNATYYWRVRACDSLNICSEWTQAFKLIVNSQLSPNEFNPPTSTINLDDVFTQNVHNFNIAATASDDTAVKNIVLYYSYNLGPWQTFPEIITGVSGDFHFTSPLGDGLYSFESIATDIFDNQESNEKFNTWTNQVLVDTIAPTTNLDNSSLIDHYYYGQNYLINGDFEDGMNGWIAGSSIGDHLIANVGPTNISPDNNAFILGSETKTINGSDSLFQTMALPASASSTLSFSYRFFSHDTADYDKFTVNLIGASGSTIFENILNVGNLETSVFDYDTGWQTISRSINYLAGQTFKMLFTLIDTGEADEFGEYNSYVYLDDVKLSTLDLRVGYTDTTSFLATDLGSIITTTTPDLTLNTGENDLNFSSSDSTGNVENPNHQSILVLSAIVLNKIDKNKIVLFNNSQTETIDVDNYFYSIDTGPTISLTGTILPLQSSEEIILSTTLPDSCEIKLYKDTDIVDSTTISNLGDSIWQRQSDGLGPWVKINTPLDFNLESRPLVSKITLTVFGLVTTLPDMHYTINYTDSSGPQQIYGQILPNTIDSNGSSARDFYLGTCSTGGNCIPSLDLGSTFTVIFNGLEKTFVF